MGHLYRFVEPAILLLLRRKGEAHGYELASDLPQYALTDAEVETAALYRTLRMLEQNGNVTSRWDTGSKHAFTFYGIFKEKRILWKLIRAAS